MLGGINDPMLTTQETFGYMLSSGHWQRPISMLEDIDEPTLIAHGAFGYKLSGLVEP